MTRLRYGPGMQTVTPSGALALGPYSPVFGTSTIGELLPAVYNPRVMSVVERDKLVRSIETFGFVEPVVRRAEDGLVIGGHQRVLALSELLRRRGLSEEAIYAYDVPDVRLTGLSDDRAKLLNLALNRISGDWDHTRLAEVLGSLEALTVPELELSGFGLPEIQDFSAMMKGLPVLSQGGPSATPPARGGGGGDSAGPDTDGGTPSTAITSATDAANAALMRLIVEFPSADLAEEVRTSLVAWGMTGDGDAHLALLALVRASSPPEKTDAPKRRRKTG